MEQLAIADYLSAIAFLIERGENHGGILQSQISTGKYI